MDQEVNEPSMNLLRDVFPNACSFIHTWEHNITLFSFLMISCHTQATNILNSRLEKTFPHQQLGSNVSRFSFHIQNPSFFIISAKVRLVDSVLVSQIMLLGTFLFYRFFRSGGDNVLWGGGKRLFVF